MAAPIASIRKNSREELRVELDHYKNLDLFSAWVWFKGDDETMRPGKRGISIKVSLLPEFARAVNAALAEAEKRGLLQ